MAERRRNQEKLGIVSEKDLTAIVTLERRDSAMSEVVFEAEVGVVHHYLESQKLLFVILSFAVCILNYISVQEVISRILSEPAAAMAFSNYLVIVMVGLDVYYCFLYTLLGIILGMNFYKYVTMLTFGYFLMFVAFDLRLFHLISRIYLERNSVQDSPAQFRKRVLVYNIKHYICLFISFYVVLRFGISGSIFIALGVLPFSVVAHNVQSKVSYLPDQFEFFFSYCLKTFVFVYLFGYPDNFLELSTKPGYLTFMCLGIVTAWILARLQYDHGADWVLPKRFRAVRFNYLQELEDLSSETIASDVEDSRNLCAICMSHLSTTHGDEGGELENPPHGENMERIYGNMRRYVNTHYMKTPCQHEFHISCLVNWMKVKMECPTCRRELPELS